MTTISAPVVATRKPLYQSLFVQVVAALLLGIVLGMTARDFAISLKIFSDAFLKLISMIVAPIVFCVVVHGIAGAGDLKKVGRVGVKALVYFETMTSPRGKATLTSTSAPRARWRRVRGRYGGLSG